MWRGERDSKCEETIRQIGKMDSAAGLTKWIFLCLCLSRCAYACHILEEPRIVNAGDSMVQNSNPGLKIYCHNATSKKITCMWRIMTMHLNINSDSYILYDGQTPDEIYQKCDEDDRFWSLNLSDTRKQCQIDPFKNVCIGVYVDSPSESGYRITLEKLQRKTLIGWMMAVGIMGIILFCCANILSRSSLICYACHFGVALPAIILIHITEELISEGCYRVIFGATMSLCIIASILWENMQLIVTQYKIWLICYFPVTWLFSATYKNFGLGADAREITQQILQVVGSVLVFYSINFYEGFLVCCFWFIVYIYNKFPRAAFQ